MRFLKQSHRNDYDLARIPTVLHADLMVTPMIGSKPPFTNHAVHARVALTDVNIAHVHIEMPLGIILETLASLPPVTLLVWQDTAAFFQLAIVIYAIIAFVTSTIEPDTGGGHHIFVFVVKGEPPQSASRVHKARWCNLYFGS